MLLDGGAALVGEVNLYYRSWGCGEANEVDEVSELGGVGKVDEIGKVGEVSKIGKVGEASEAGYVGEGDGNRTKATLEMHHRNVN